MRYKFQMQISRKQIIKLIVGWWHYPWEWKQETAAREKWWRLWWHNQLLLITEMCSLFTVERTRSEWRFTSKIFQRRTYCRTKDIQTIIENYAICNIELCKSFIKGKSDIPLSSNIRYSVNYFSNVTGCSSSYRLFRNFVHNSF